MVVLLAIDSRPASSPKLVHHSLEYVPSLRFHLLKLLVRLNCQLLGYCKDCDWISGPTNINDIAIPENSMAN